ncbi:hypothetical protein BC830DRAFT_1138443 [Chytriomyces sp. MP71]|nr:hypothetical protein BC830DRAFT_1138443 [Chytriomyces sp. MP71]
MDTPARDSDDSLDDILAGYSSVEADDARAAEPVTVAQFLGSDPGSVSGHILVVRKTDYPDNQEPAFDRRFVIVSHAHLFLFVTAAMSAKPIDTMRLRPSSLVNPVSENVKNPLAFEVADGKGTLWTLATQNKSSKNQWIELLRASIAASGDPIDTAPSPPLPTFKARGSSLVHSLHMAESASPGSLHPVVSLPRPPIRDEADPAVLLAQMAMGRRTYSETDYFDVWPDVGAGNATGVASYGPGARGASVDAMSENAMADRMTPSSFRSSTQSGGPPILAQHVSVLSSISASGGIPGGGVFGRLHTTADDDLPVLGRPYEGAWNVLTQKEVWKLENHAWLRTSNPCFPDSRCIHSSRGGATLPWPR